METSSIVGIVVTIFLIAAMFTLILQKMVEFEMDHGPEEFNPEQRKTALVHLWTLTMCAAGLLNCLFLLWVTYVPH